MWQKQQGLCDAQGGIDVEDLLTRTVAQIVAVINEKHECTKQLLDMQHAHNHMVWNSFIKHEQMNLPFPPDLRSYSKFPESSVQPPPQPTTTASSTPSSIPASAPAKGETEPEIVVECILPQTDQVSMNGNGVKAEGVKAEVDKLQLPVKKKKPHHIEIPKTEKKRSSNSGSVQSSTSFVNHEPTRLERMISSQTFSMAMISVIALNVVVVVWEMEWNGLDAAYRLGMTHADPGWGQASPFFRASDMFFNCSYAVELFLRIAVHRWEFFRCYINVADALVVFTCFTNTMVSVILDSRLVNTSVLRIIRVLRIMRIAAEAHGVIHHVTEHMTELRILVDTLSFSFRGLGWSVLMLFFIIASAAVLMTQLALGSVEDEGIPLESRRWLHDSFGTTFRSAYSMWEITFTSGWITYVRPLIFDISHVYILFMLPYVVCVNFAVMRVVSALFLRQTLAVASRDEEMKVLAERKERERIARDLEHFFTTADTSNDGAVSVEEFETMLSHPSMMEHFAALGLEVEEAVALFCMLAQEDGEADYEEFVAACLKMRSSSQVIDIWMCLTNLTKTLHEISDRLQEKLG